MKKLLLLMLSLAAIYSCEESLPKPTLTLLSKNQVAINENGDEFQIEFTTNYEWLAEVVEGSEWCSLDNYMGKSGNDITINATAIKNPLGGDRTARIFITSETNQEEITVTQSAHSELTIASTDTTRCYSKGGEFFVRFSANKDWSIEVVDGGDWLSCSEASGEATLNGEFAVNITKNDGKRREAEVFITSGEVKKSVYFIQHPVPPTVSGDFSDWDCYIPTPNNAFLDQSTLVVGHRFFKVSLPDPENYRWGVVNEFQKSDLYCYSSSVVGLDGEEFQVGTLRMGPGDPAITNNLVVFAIDKKTEEPIFEDAVMVELTIFSSGRLPDASKGEYVKVGDFELCDRNIGENVPTPEEAPFALNYNDTYPDVNAEWAGDNIMWYDAVDQYGNEDGWRLPTHEECLVLQSRLSYSKGRYYISSDNEDGAVACWLPMNHGSAGGSYWSSTPSESTTQYAIYLGFSKGGSAIINGMKSWKFSVRCIRSL